VGEGVGGGSEAWVRVKVKVKVRGGAGDWGWVWLQSCGSRAPVSCRRSVQLPRPHAHPPARSSTLTLTRTRTLPRTFNLNLDAVPPTSPNRTVRCCDGRTLRLAAAGLLIVLACSGASRGFARAAHGAPDGRALDSPCARERLGSCHRRSWRSQTRSLGHASYLSGRAGARSSRCQNHS
jgi:hypothetical protein